jgi:ubiquinone/menaquinone biosynthesis C-methylase UbiE
MITKKIILHKQSLCCVTQSTSLFARNKTTTTTTVKQQFHTMTTMSNTTESNTGDVKVQWNLFTDKKHTEDYAKFRPSYPKELIHQIFESVNKNGTLKIVDIGCGSGQATMQLAQYCAEAKLQPQNVSILGLDPSANQIQNANDLLSESEYKQFIQYGVSAAESTNIESNSVDIITVAQALHWFDLDVFFKEVDRILKPNGILAVITYDLNKFDIQNAQDELLVLYNDQLGTKYWSPKRKMVDEQYSKVNFPYTNTLKKHVFPYKKNMTVNEYIQYLGTWSAIQKYRTENPDEPIDILEKFKQRLIPALNVTSGEDLVDINWPMYLITVTK